MKLRDTLIVILFFMGSCAHMSDKQRALTAVAVGAATGAAITAIAAKSSKDHGQDKDILGNALIGAAAGGAYSLFFQKDDDGIRNAEIDRRIKEAGEKSEMGALNDGKFPQVKPGCSDEDSLYFCSSSDPRVPSNCKDLGTIYLNKHTAVKYKVWYSPKGCFEEKDSSYKLVPELEQYFDKVRKQ